MIHSIEHVKNMTIMLLGFVASNEILSVFSVDQFKIVGVVFIISKHRRNQHPAPYASGFMFNFWHTKYLSHFYDVKASDKN